MREHPNAVLVRQFYEALARSHRVQMEGLLSPACSLSVDGRHRLSGGFSGRRATVEWFFRARRASPSGLDFTPLTIAAIGELGIAVEHLYASAADTTLSVDALRVFHVAGGLIEQVRAIDLDPIAVAAFWGGPRCAASSLQASQSTVAPVTSTAALTPGRDA